MVCLVVDDDRLAGTCSALLDEKSREVLLSLQKGPLTLDQLSEMLIISKKDAKDRIERLTEAKLVRRTPGIAGGPDLYSLEFSMEIEGACPDQSLVEELYQEIGNSFFSFLEKNSDKISALCDSMGASLGRAVEQVFLSSVSRVVKDLQIEINEEDRRLSAHLGTIQPT
ncbi:MAG: winged helix-turn-helix domain-containing protein [Candidatus Verstraetearchaeota archaeon]|nr:winged helix-turn-helix domain-containing protein [Candidatus Verstraetearchaeota archaeon]